MVDVVPASKSLLPQYVDALKQGLSPDNVRGAVAAREILRDIEKDANAFLKRQEDEEATGPPVTLPDGSQVTRLPGFVRWISDGSFCGTIGFRWQPGTDELPDHVLGHIGFAVVPWKRGKGYAKGALAIVLKEARLRGLNSVFLTTDVDNIASQKVIEANGAAPARQFTKPKMYGGGPGLRYSISLEP